MLKSRNFKIVRTIGQIKNFTMNASNNIIKNHQYQERVITAPVSNLREINIEITEEENQSYWKKDEEMKRNRGDQIHSA